MTRDEILDKAKQCVTGDRDHDYGGPERSFDCIAKMWTAYLQYARQAAEISFTPADVAAMMAMLKLARIAKSPEKADSWIDLAGYAACGGECATPPPYEQSIREAGDAIEAFCDTHKCDCQDCPIHTECNNYVKIRNYASALMVLEKLKMLKQGEGVDNQ